MMTESKVQHVYVDGTEVYEGVQEFAIALLEKSKGYIHYYTDDMKREILNSIDRGKVGTKIKFEVIE